MNIPEISIISGRVEKNQKNTIHQQDIYFAKKAIHHERNYNQLYNAIIAQNYKLVRILIEGGLDVNICLESGTTPLMTACSCLKESKNHEKATFIIRYLLSKGADAFRLDKWRKNCIAYARSYSRDGILVVKSILQQEGVIPSPCDNSTGESSPRLLRKSVTEVSHGKLFYDYTMYDGVGLV